MTEKLRATTLRWPTELHRWATVRAYDEGRSVQELTLDAVQRYRAAIEDGERDDFPGTAPEGGQ